MLWLEHLGLDAQKDDIRFLVIGDQTLLAQGLEIQINKFREKKIFFFFFF